LISSRIEGGNFMGFYVGAHGAEANRGYGSSPLYWRNPQPHDKESAAKGRQLWR